MEVVCGPGGLVVALGRLLEALVSREVQVGRDRLMSDIEIHADNEGLHDFFGMVRSAAEGWDVSEPPRRLPS